MPQTGPKTPHGKAAVSRNAEKHGILSDAPVVLQIGEDYDEWERHRVAMIDSLEPENHLEIVLVERIANLVWRIKRLERYETEMIVARLNSMPDDLSVGALWDHKRGIPVEQSVTLEKVEDQMRRRMIPEDRIVATIMRYEASLHRQSIQYLHELEAMQTRRKGGASPLARLDITGAPGGD